MKETVSEIEEEKYKEKEKETEKEKGSIMTLLTREQVNERKKE